MIYTVSAFSLKVLAGITWYLGSVLLFLKGKSLSDAASMLEPESSLPIMVLFVGLIIGLIKAKYIFFKSGKKNIERIHKLQNPKIWEFFRPGFYIFLILMILFGASLSEMAQGEFIYLLSVAALDFSLSTALAVSGLQYLKRR